MSEVLKTIGAGLAAASALDQVNLVLGIAGVALMVRRSLWAFPVGLVAVTVQGVLFFRAKFYADATLQIFFFGALAWGWWNWMRAGKRDGGVGGERDEGVASPTEVKMKRDGGVASPTAELKPRDGGVASPTAELPVTTMGTRGRALTLAAGVAATVAWALAMRAWTDAVMPWRDAGIAAFSVAAQALQARKKLENWPLWVAVNLVAIGAYWSADLAYTAFLYAVYLGLAAMGWRAWARAMAGERRDGGVASPAGVAARGGEADAKLEKKGGRQDAGATP